jgi:hypothetical protein
VQPGPSKSAAPGTPARTFTSNRGNELELEFAMTLLETGASRERRPPAPRPSHDRIICRSRPSCQFQTIISLRRDRPISAFFDLNLNWSEEVVTSCAFDLFPDWIIDWIMLSWTIEGAGRGGSPSAATLAKIAKAYKAASKALARPPTPTGPRVVVIRR